MRGAGAPTLTDILNLASEIGHPADDAERYHANRTAKGWHGIADWQSDFAGWRAQYRPPAQSARKYDPEAVDPAILEAQRNRRTVKDAILAAATAAGRRLNQHEAVQIVKGDPTLAGLPADDRAHGITAALNASEHLCLPAAVGTTPGPFAGAVGRALASVTEVAR